MILDRQLTRDDQLASQRYYRLFNFVNGFAYMCLGETVLLLFAVKLGCSDSLVAILGSMCQLGYLLLVLGKVMTARSGAAGSQANFWVLRNLAALLVAAAAPAAIYLGSLAAAILLLVGSFLFYGFRAAGVVMAQPLVGEFCLKSELGSFMFRCWCAFYISGLLALALISLLLRFYSGVWILFAVVVSGAVSGLISSGFIRKIRESREIMLSAREPILPLIFKVCRNHYVLRQMLAGMCCNAIQVMLMPISMLTLKRGYGVSDSSALLYSLASFGFLAVVCRMLGKFADRYGGRIVTLVGFYGAFLVPVFWLVVPGEYNFILLLIPFLFGPMVLVMTLVGLQQYFLHTVSKNQQIVATMLISVINGVVSGGVGGALSALLLKIANCFNPDGPMLLTYRFYFLGTLLIMPLMALLMHRLKKEPTANGISLSEK